MKRLRRGLPTATRSVAGSTRTTLTARAAAAKREKRMSSLELTFVVLQPVGAQQAVGLAARGGGFNALTNRESRQ
jgi:hypothetical protein